MNLWIDDERLPPDGWVWAKTYDEAIKHIDTGKVEFISFDHDLGGKKTGYDIATYIELGAMRKTIKKIGWRCHSANPIGKKRIIQSMQMADKIWNG